MGMRKYNITPYTIHNTPNSFANLVDANLPLYTKGGLLHFQKDNIWFKPPSLDVYIEEYSTHCDVCMLICYSVNQIVYKKSSHMKISAIMAYRHIGNHKYRRVRQKCHINMPLVLTQSTLL